MRTVTGATTSVELREHNRARLLRAVHECGASRTRSQLTKDLDLARGTASVLVTGLSEDSLLHEEPSAEHGRGRPTQIPGPHPCGPVALAADLREDGWEIAAGELGGRITPLAARPHDGTPEGAFGPLAAALRTHLQRYGSRAVGIGLAVPGPVRDDRLVDVSHLGWRAVDAVAGLASGIPAGTLLHVGNDTAFAALAEARRGRMAGVRVGLHLHVDFDLGGVLVVDGRPLGGATGVGAEFGHMPLTGRADPCLCGARGCWAMEVGANALLRHLGLAAGGGRGRDQAQAILARSGKGDPEAAEAVDAGARALGRGIAALVNAHDPEIVTLSGLGVDLFTQGRAALSEAYLAGLMRIRVERLPELAPSELGWSGALLGAMESVFDAFLTPEGLRTWRPRERP
ncbi:ROK family protein [Nonomuraea endophytica]|uniref:Putative NBD/HSP70 family sugar kinase n=1 Tax=Nonomuraea endophytica TaxID=714136 RepID=A0A7W8EFW6_9ACTN|nr:ROK family protein [Nonomuraea endophytica]MBB5077858.1 putative NBD/HSP70 family sugar kinase [Nonomuraea endophytica]